MAMPILRLGLVLGTLAFLYVAWASFRAGYPVETALVRGGLSFMALSFVAYLGELVVATAPPLASEETATVDDAANDDGTADDNEPEHGSDQDDGTAGGKIGVTSALTALMPASSADDEDNDELQAA